MKTSIKIETDNINKLSLCDVSKETKIIKNKHKDTLKYKTIQVRRKTDKAIIRYSKLHTIS